MIDKIDLKEVEILLDLALKVERESPKGFLLR